MSSSYSSKPAPQEVSADAVAVDDARCAAALAVVAEDHGRLASRWVALAAAIEAGAGAAAVREAIVDLIEAARGHFVTEEWAMRTVRWPDYLAHKTEHARLLRDACDMLKNFDVAFAAEDWPALATYFRHWLATHHRRHDDALLASLSGWQRQFPAA